MFKTKFKELTLRCFKKLGLHIAEHATIRGFHPMMFFVVVVMHAAVLLAPFNFSWSALLASITLLFFTGELGINVGYHRLLSHSSFRSTRWLKRTLAILGSLSFQGGPITWASMHRIHHREADRSLDPHTPLVSFCWAEFFWVFFDHPYFLDLPSKVRFARDLNRVPVLRFIERWHVETNLLFFGFLAMIGGIVDGYPGVVSWLLWCGVTRIVLIWHLTFIVNSVNHLWGYRNYETNDNSRNNVWISIIVFLGEGWHNNHHAQPRSAAHGHRWFEFDLAYWLIVGFQRLGWARNVQLPR